MRIGWRENDYWSTRHPAVHHSVRGLIEFVRGFHISKQRIKF